jgi:hypothetical protein
MRQPLRIVRQGKCIVVRGNARQILLDGRFTPYYVGTLKGFMLDAHREGDLLAYLDSRGVPYVLGEAA